MACYQCGSPDGDETRLCPSCNKTRAAENAVSFDDRLKQEYRLTFKTVAKILYGDALRVVIVSGMICLALLYYFTISSDGPGWFSAASRIERACNRQVDSAMEFSSSGSSLPIDHPFSPGGGMEIVLREQFGNVGGEMALALASGQRSICADLKVTCKASGTDHFCKKIRELL